AEFYSGAFNGGFRLDDALDRSNGHDGPVRCVLRALMWARRQLASRPDACAASGPGHRPLGRRAIAGTRLPVLGRRPSVRPPALARLLSAEPGFARPAWAAPAWWRSPCRRPFVNRARPAPRPGPPDPSRRDRRARPLDSAAGRSRSG